MVSTSRERRNQNLSMISSQRAQLVQETRNQRVANLAKIQHKREMDQYSLAERSREIRAQEKNALKRRDILKKNQQKELIRNAREHLAQEHQKKVRCFELYVRSGFVAF